MLVSAVKAGEAAAVLGVELDGLTPDAIGKAFRSKSKDCHPDHHGSSRISQWSQISWARDCLNRWLEHNPPVSERLSEDLDVGIKCRACGGTGRVKVGTSARFGTPLTMQCVICRGEGSVTPEENDCD